MSDQPELHHLVSVSEHPLSLSGPLLSIIALIVPTAMIGPTRQGMAMSLYTKTENPEHDPAAIERLMEWLDEQ